MLLFLENYLFFFKKKVRVSISGIDEMDSEDPFFGGLQSGDEVAQEDISLTNQIINQRKSTHK